MSVDRDIDAGVAVIALVALVIIGVALFSAYKGINSSLSELAKKILTSVAKALTKAEDAAYTVRARISEPIGNQSGYGPDVLRTGINSSQADQIQANQAAYPDTGSLGGQ